MKTETITFEVSKETKMRAEKAKTSLNLSEAELFEIGLNALVPPKRRAARRSHPLPE